MRFYGVLGAVNVRCTTGRKVLSVRVHERGEDPLATSKKKTVHQQGERGNVRENGELQKEKKENNDTRRSGPDARKRSSGGGGHADGHWHLWKIQENATGRLRATMLANGSTGLRACTRHSGDRARGGLWRWWNGRETE